MKINDKYTLFLSRHRKQIFLLIAAKQAGAVSKAGTETNYLFEFLTAGTKNYTSLDIEIMNKIICLNDRQKQAVNTCLTEFRQA